MARDQLTERMKDFQTFVNNHGWSITSEKAIAYGYQFMVSDGKSQVPVALYTTGKVLVQGKSSPLQAALKTWSTTQEQAEAPATLLLPDDEPATVSKQDQYAGLARIGSDESGKGDFYGPLAVAAVSVEAKTEQYLNAQGVRDSKKLTDRTISLLATEIKARCPYSLLVYMPGDYNKHYLEVQNLNTLLAHAHAQVIHDLAQRTHSSLAIVDQFGDEALVRLALQQTGCAIRLEQRHRAEDDIAVAAASIVARAAFVEQLQSLSSLLGLDLPKGASNPRIVEVGREIIQHYGPAALENIAKLHFKTAETILQC